MQALIICAFPFFSLSMQADFSWILIARETAIVSNTSLELKEHL